MRRTTVFVTAAVLVIAALPPAGARAGTSASAAPGGAAARADINGDGYADVVVSTGARLTYPGDTALSPNDLGGSVSVVPGGPAGVPGKPPVLVNQANPNVATGMETDDRFGLALATGDFNGDGLADVAIGNPTESIAGKASAGTVSVLYGQRTAPYLRLIPGGLDRIDQNSPEVPGDVEPGDLFGASLAVGDFNADGYADLAIGSPGEAIGTLARGGITLALYGSPSGLTARGAQSFGQESGNLYGTAEAGDLFGWSVAAGDVTGDGRDDLAVISSGDAITADTWGVVHLIPGSATGLDLTKSTSRYTPDAPVQDHWRSVVIGRFHGGANADVVIGTDRRRGAPQNSGALIVIRGGAAGLTSTIQVIDQSSAGIPDTNEENDYFGGSLAAGDLDGDTFTDLVVGTLRENGGAGAITLLRGGTAGLLSAPGTFASENNPRIAASAQSAEGFSYGLRVLDVTGDGKAEVLVSAPWEDFSLQSGTLFVLDIGLSGESFTVTGSRRAGRTELGSGSNYGPGVPIAGGTVVLNDNTDSPR